LQKILHFHIPKTGGIAIRHYFVDQLGEARVSPSVVGSRLSDALLRWDDLDVVSGHFLLRQGDRLPADRCGVTVLRNPIDRFLSEYFFAKSDNADRLLDTKLHALDLDTYLDKLTEQEVQSASCQIEMLYALGTTSQDVLSSNEKLAAALRAIDKFELVGMQDELEDFACMLDARFSWSSKPLSFKNVTSQRLQSNALTPSQACKLKSLLGAEFELYEHARMIFRRKRREYLKRSTAGHFDTPTTTNSSEDVPTNIHESRANFGDMRCSIEDVSVVGDISGDHRAMVGEHMTISITFKAHQTIDEINIGIAIRDDRGLLIFGTNSMLLGQTYSLEPGQYRIQFTMLNRAPNGKYTIDAALLQGESHYQGCYHWIDKAASFEIHNTAVTHFEGEILMDANAQMTSESPSASWRGKPYAPTSAQIKSLGRTNKPLERFESTIIPMSRDEQFFHGVDAFLPVRVENTGKESWAAYGQQLVTLTYRWLSDNNEVLVADGVRSRLPTDISPGGAAIVPMRIATPTEAGNYLLVLSLVQESVAWFVDRNPDSGHSVRIALK